MFDKICSAMYLNYEVSFHPFNLLRWNDVPRREFFAPKLLFRLAHYDTPPSTPHYCNRLAYIHKPKDSRQRLEGWRESVVKVNLSRQQRYTLNITLIKNNIII